MTETPDSDLTAANAVHNIIVSTVGNLVGGSLMVGAVYWFIYLRHRGQANRGNPDSCQLG